MKILIIGSGDFLVLAGAAVSFEAGVRGLDIEVIEASCLPQALAALDSADGVVCQQSFPTHFGRILDALETREGNWAAIADFCRRGCLPFVLVTRSRDLADKLNAVLRSDPTCAWPVFALVEPVGPDFVAETIVGAVWCQEAAEKSGHRAI